MAARLLATGMRHDLVARHIYDDEPFGALRLLGAALDRAVLEENAAGGLGLVWTVVTETDRRPSTSRSTPCERVIDVLRIATEAEVACVLKQDDAGAWRVSMRSKGRIDVSAVAHRARRRRPPLRGRLHRLGRTAATCCTPCARRLAAAEHLPE